MHGGKSFPRTGSTGDGYRFAKRAGHRSSAGPGTLPCQAEGKMAPDGRSLSLKNVSLTLLKDGTVVSRRFGELLLTHFGISGPIAMDMSRGYRRGSSRGNAALLLDLKPALTLDVLTARIGRDSMKIRRKNVRGLPEGPASRGIIPAVVERRQFPQTKAEYISPEEKMSSPAFSRSTL